jgi:hypothetical protein
VSLKIRASALSSLAVCAMLATSASAHTITGQALAAPTAGGARVTVPVLLSQRSVKRNHLHASVVTLSIGRKLKIASSAGKVAATAVSFGDQLSATVKVPKAARKSGFPSLRASKIKLLSQASNGQDAALAQKLAALGATVANLSAYVQQLAVYTYDEFGVVLGDIASDRSTMSGLSDNLGTLQTQLTGLSSLLAGLNVPGLASQVAALTTSLSSLTNTVDGLAAQIPGLLSGLTSLTTGLTGVQGLLAGIQPGQLSQALTDIGSLQALTSGLDVGAINTELTSLSGQLTGVLSSIGTVNGADLQTQLNTLQTALTGVSSSLTTAVGRINVVCSASNNLLTTGPLSLIGIGHFAGC